MGALLTQPAAGWFPDPSDPSRLRYFDGRDWTEQYANVGGPPPFPAQPAKQATKRSNWKWIAGIGAVLLAWLVFVSNIGSDNDKKSTATGGSGSSPSKSYNTQTARAEPSRPAVAPSGSSVRDGQFEFKVLGVERGGTSRDGGFGTTDTAKGEYFTVKLQVTNIGDEPRTLYASNQKLIINGNTYEATSSITDDGWKEDINPGLGATTTATFDIPPGAVPTAIECHDSAFSGGALLAL